eukprot:COSAG06_NODE_2759_length_6331_cov_12.176508_1_plen_168_part_00
MAGDYETARRQLHACFRLILREAPPWWSGQSSAWHVLGTLCAATGQTAAAVGHWRRGLVLAMRASDPMLTAIHTRDILKHTATGAAAAVDDGGPAGAGAGAAAGAAAAASNGSSVIVDDGGGDRAALIESGSVAARKVGDPALIRAFQQLQRHHQQPQQQHQHQQQR